MTNAEKSQVIAALRAEGPPPERELLMTAVARNVLRVGVPLVLSFGLAYGILNVSFGVPDRSAEKLAGGIAVACVALDRVRKYIKYLR